jgi:hypothetical protein
MESVYALDQSGELFYVWKEFPLFSLCLGCRIFGQGFTPQSLVICSIYPCIQIHPTSCRHKHNLWDLALTLLKFKPYMIKWNMKSGNKVSVLWYSITYLQMFQRNLLLSTSQPNTLRSVTLIYQTIWHNIEDSKYFHIRLLVLLFGWPRSSTHTHLQVTMLWLAYHCAIEPFTMLIPLPPLFRKENLLWCRWNEESGLCLQSVSEVGCKMPQSGLSRTCFNSSLWPLKERDLLGAPMI